MNSCYCSSTKKKRKALLLIRQQSVNQSVSDLPVLLEVGGHEELRKLLTNYRAQ